MKVGEFMNREVVALRPEYSIREGAQLLRKNSTSALPVVNGNGSIVGMLTDEGVLTRLRTRSHPWWQTLFTESAALAQEYQKAVGTKVKDVMRPAPVPVDPETTLESAAERLERAGTGVLPVLADGHLVGTVGYGDLVKAVAEKPAQTAEAAPTDEELVAELKARLAPEVWVSNRSLWVDAKNGVIMLFGMVDTQEEEAALGVMAQTIPGCKGVETNLFPRSLLPGRGHWL
jgi:CBS domain-containing protein